MLFKYIVIRSPVSLLPIFNTPIKIVIKTHTPLWASRRNLHSNAMSYDFQIIFMYT